MNQNKTIIYLCVSLITTELFSVETKTIPTEKTKNSGTVIVAISGQTIAQNSKLGQAAQKEFKAKQEKLTIPLKEDEEKITNKDKKLTKIMTILVSFRWLFFDVSVGGSCLSFLTPISAADLIW